MDSMNGIERMESNGMESNGRMNRMDYRVELSSKVE